MGSHKKSKKSKQPSKKSKGSKKTTKAVLQFRPNKDQRIEILKKCKMHNKILWGKFPEGKSFNDRRKVEIELLEFVKKTCPTPEGFNWPKFDRVFKKWRGAFVKMVTRSKQTGKSPEKPWTSEQHLMYDIVGNNIQHQKNIKVWKF